AAATAAGQFDLGAGNASVNLIWIDFIRVTGPPGNITFRLRLVVSGSVTGGPPSGCLNVSTFLAQAAISSAALTVRRGVPGGSCNTANQGELDQTTTFTAPSGTLLAFTGSLLMSAA